MKIPYSLVFASVVWLAAATSLPAQTAAPFNAAEAKATLSNEAVRPKYSPKGPVASRVYVKNSKGLNVEVTTFEDGKKEEHPYVPVPILFVVGSDELLDDTSRQNVQALAKILKELCAEGAKFTIQGHTSAEGAAETNQLLSERRAKRIQTLLTQGGGIDPDLLISMGFGSSFAVAAESDPESKRQQDRRVLVVRK